LEAPKDLRPKHASPKAEVKSSAPGEVTDSPRCQAELGQEHPDQGAPAEKFDSRSQRKEPSGGPVTSVIGSGARLDDLGFVALKPEVG
jgi:hypothetical protein